MTAQQKRPELDQETIDDLRLETQSIIAEQLAREDQLKAAVAVRDLRLEGMGRTPILRQPVCTHGDGIKRLAAKIEHTTWMLRSANPGTHLRLELERERSVLIEALATLLGPESKRNSALELIGKLVKEAREEREKASSAE